MVHTNNEQQTTKIWATFTYHSPLIRKITNVFKHTNTWVAFKTINILQQLTKPITNQNTLEHERSRIYKLTCNPCKLTYIGQTSRNLQQRYKAHTHYIK